MAQTILYAYEASAFGDSLPDDPAGLAQTRVSVPVTLGRAATAVELPLDEGANHLSQGVTLAGVPFHAGDAAERLWRLTDRGKGVSVAAYRLRAARLADTTRLVLAARLPLTPGRTYHLSVPAPAGSAAASEFPGGLAAGTRILTEDGKRPIESIAPGDRIWTEAEGFRPVLWRGAGQVAARGIAAPLRLRRGQLGLSDDLVIAAGHHIRLDGLSPDDAPVLAPALVLEAAGRAAREFGGSVTYHHLLLARHAVIFANGLACESLWPEGAGDAPPPDWPGTDSLPDTPALPRIAAQDALARLPR